MWVGVLLMAAVVALFVGAGVRERRAGRSAYWQFGIAAILGVFVVVGLLSIPVWRS